MVTRQLNPSGIFHFINPPCDHQPSTYQLDPIRAERRGFMQRGGATIVFSYKLNESKQNDDVYYLCLNPTSVISYAAVCIWSCCSWQMCYSRAKFHSELINYRRRKKQFQIRRGVCRQDLNLEEEEQRVQGEAAVYRCCWGGAEKWLNALWIRYKSTPSQIYKSCKNEA